MHVARSLGCPKPKLRCQQCIKIAILVKMSSCFIIYGLYLDTLSGNNYVFGSFEEILRFYKINILETLLILLIWDQRQSVAVTRV